jgi:hypothetical protein
MPLCNPAPFYGALAASTSTKLAMSPWPRFGESTLVYDEVLDDDDHVEARYDVHVLVRYGTDDKLYCVGRLPPLSAGARARFVSPIDESTLTHLSLDMQFAAECMQVKAQWRSTLDDELFDERALRLPLRLKLALHHIEDTCFWLYVSPQAVCPIIDARVLRRQGFALA